MESIHIQEKFKCLYTNRVDVKQYLENFKDKIELPYFGRLKSEALMSTLNVSKEEYEKLKNVCDHNQLKHKGISKPYVPHRRFNPKWSLYNVSDIDSSLQTLNYFKSNKNEAKKDKLRRLGLMRYHGKTYLEVDSCREDNNRPRTLYNKRDIMFCVRMSTCSLSKRKVQMSHEYLIPGRLLLTDLKDKIICEADYQPIDPSFDGESNPRYGDVHKFGMFYINNTFYLDGRWGRDEPCHDYTKEILKWGKKKKINFGEVKYMDKVTFESLIVRLGYPYVYIHLGNCEHLITFTDARLVSKSDLPFLEDYPLMFTFAPLSPRFCALCGDNVSKFCVTGCENLPLDKALICRNCCLFYIFDEKGNKVAPCEVYKYVDRTAIL